MPSIIANKLTKTVTIGADGKFTVDSTTGIYPGQIGWVYRSGVGNVRVKVIEIRSSTVFLATRFPENYDPTGLSGYQFNNCPSDLSALSTGSIFFEQQSVPTLNNA